MTDTIAIELEGIQFRTVMPKREIVIPRKQQTTKISFGMEITNTTQSTQKFLLFYFCPEFRNINQQVVQRTGPNSNSCYLPDWFNFVFLGTGESIAFTRPGELYWRQDDLCLAFREKSGSVWTFTKFKPGDYFLQMRYTNPHSVWNQENACGSEFTEIRDVWYGDILTPPLLFHLLPSSE